MDWQFLKDLAPSVAAVVVIGYICIRLVEKWSQSEENYTSFVNSNNHTTTELVKEATETMVQVRESIKTHTQAVEKLLDKINDRKI